MNFSCSTCGSINYKEIEIGKWKCLGCGNKYNAEDFLDDVSLNLVYANKQRIEDYNFKDALESCQKVLKEKPDCQEANWCALLSEFQVAYVQDKDGKYKATFMDPDKGSLKDSLYYKKLNTTYQIRADEIENSRKQVCFVEENCPNYSVFISFKSGTVDEKYAETLYDKLNKNGRYGNVFFSNSKDCIPNGVD